ncbi:cation:dicarboxylase symporter family transporter [Hymenobacter sp. 5516J-16]|nr:cation:dicarboxylase symporter family transporter [Hymenobacter sp. 5516J-16]UOQ76993.1 cation:dicarboxylase symporter family transporter [Hymenobacter sp. 5516J-16]
MLASTLAATRVIPVEGVALLLGVDRFMSEARAITNVIGNGVATLVIAKSENEFDEARHQRALQGLAVSGRKHSSLPTRFPKHIRTLRCQTNNAIKAASAAAQSSYKQSCLRIINYINCNIIYLFLRSSSLTTCLTIS